jgi:hypothetical protein
VVVAFVPQATAVAIRMYVSKHGPGPLMVVVKNGVVAAGSQIKLMVAEHEQLARGLQIELVPYIWAPSSVRAIVQLSVWASWMAP